MSELKFRVKSYGSSGDYYSTYKHQPGFSPHNSQSYICVQGKDIPPPL